MARRVTSALPIVDDNPGTCGGQCCEAFYLPYSFAEVWRAWEAWRAGKKQWTDDRGKDRAIPTDIELLAPMVRSLGTYQVSIWGIRHNGEREMFTCAHYNPRGRRCEIYEHRPQVCRDHGQGDKACHVPSCTWADNRTPKAEAAKEDA